MPPPDDKPSKKNPSAPAVLQNGKKGYFFPSPFTRMRMPLYPSN
jgi:hypothetical protein